MRIEDAATIAARWWTDKLRDKELGSAGDVSGDTLVLLTFSKKVCKQPSETQLLDFQNILRKNIVDSIVEVDCWHEDDPRRGSGLRIISTSYSPDKALSNSANAVGIEVEIFPTYAITWIDPDGVWVKLGYNGDRILVCQ